MVRQINPFDTAALILYLELPLFRKLGFLRYASHVLYGDLNAVPRCNK